MNLHAVTKHCDCQNLRRTTVSAFPIDRAQNIRTVEDELAALTRDRPHELLLPVDLDESSVGGEAALIQLVITWARMHDDSYLFTHVQEPKEVVLRGKPDASNADRQLERMSERGFGFVALMMAKDIVSRSGLRSLRQLAHLKCKTRVERMIDGLDRAVHGNRILLACVDQSSKAALPQFYYSDGLPRNRPEFERLAKAIIDESDSWGKERNATPELIDGLGAIIHELIRNTHDWARTDELDVPYRRSVRGLLVSRHRMPLAVMKRHVEGSAPLETYVSHEHLIDDDGLARFLEMSIFDSGPGLARRWLVVQDLRDLGIHEEYAACLQCLRKHRTSSRKPQAGLGLYDVLRTLSPLQAFVRLRTGRLALFRDFVAEPLKSNELASGGELFDWHSGSVSVSERPPVEGTLYTILLPLHRNS